MVVLCYNICNMNIAWWSFVLLNFIGYFIFRWSYITEGAIGKETPRALGTFLLIISLILMFIFQGWKQAVLLLLVSWIIFTPLIMFLMNRVEKKLYPDREEFDRKMAEKYGVTVDEIKRRRGLTESEHQEEVNKIINSWKNK